MTQIEVSAFDILKYFWIQSVDFMGRTWSNRINNRILTKSMFYLNTRNSKYLNHCRNWKRFCIKNIVWNKFILSIKLIKIIQIYKMKITKLMFLAAANGQLGEFFVRSKHTIENWRSKTSDFFLYFFNDFFSRQIGWKTDQFSKATKSFWMVFRKEKFTF